MTGIDMASYGLIGAKTKSGGQSSSSAAAADYDLAAPGGRKEAAESSYDLASPRAAAPSAKAEKPYVRRGTTAEVATTDAVQWSVHGPVLLL